MEHRQRRPETVLCCQFITIRQRHAVSDHRLVTDHAAFRVSGGARRVQDAGEIFEDVGFEVRNRTVLPADDLHQFVGALHRHLVSGEQRREVGGRLGEVLRVGRHDPLHPQLHGDRLHHRSQQVEAHENAPYVVGVYDGKDMRVEPPGPFQIPTGAVMAFMGEETQVREFGEIETPILLTCTLCVWSAANALKDWTYEQPGMGEHTLNPVVGETNDARVNNMWADPVGNREVRAALENAATGPVAEGSVGAGTGTQAFGWKGGIGTSSRVLPAALGGYTVGVLVQTNFGGTLTMNGAPVGRELLDRDLALEGHGRRLAHRLLQVEALEVLHRDVGRPVVGAQVEHRHHVGVRHLRDGTGLTFEAGLQMRVGGCLGRQDLDDNLATQFHLGREEPEGRDLLAVVSIHSYTLPQEGSAPR